MPRAPHNSTTPEASISRPIPAEANEYSREERELLLRLAHQAIETLVQGQRFEPGRPSAHLEEPRGVFTTLYLGGQLRGCVGYVFPITPLYRAVIETARSAASEDSRFLPIRREEVPGLEVSLSVLSRLVPIAADQVEVGRHGLLVTRAGHRGLLLPQVPVEHGWDRVAFLEQTCRKAGLPLDAWSQGATLEAFTAEVFGDSQRSK